MTDNRRIIVGKALLTLPMIAGVGLALLMFPGSRRLRQYRRTSLDGVVNLNHAVRVCRRSDLEGWPLVTFAQQLVARKFTTYSTLNLWDPPGRAFIYGTGYCTQYNLALKRILDRLGFSTETVFALKTRFLNNEAWSMGHTWLRVTLEGEARDVCAGSEENRPGDVNFEPLSPKYPGRPLTILLTHCGLILLMGVLEWKALLTGTEPPTWAYEERG